MENAIVDIVVELFKGKYRIRMFLNKEPVAKII